MSYNHLFKIVVIGDHNSGKSCILLRFAENTFRDDHISTLGVDFKLKTIKLGRDRVRLELWDTAGMERYRTIYNSYYHSAHGVMCVYDMTDRRSFDNIKNYWLAEIRRHAPQNAVLMLVGNKADLVDQRSVDFATAEQFASEVGLSLYECSARTGINCEEAFAELATAMRDRLLLAKMDDNCAGDGADQSCDDDDDVGRGTSTSSGFHVDGVVGGSRQKGYAAAVSATCCANGPPATFV